MRPTTLRTYVWSFCLYLFSTANWIFLRSKGDWSLYKERSFTNITNLITQGFVIFLFVCIFAELRNAIDKWIVALSIASFAMTLLFDLHRLNYMPSVIPHWLAGFIFFLATIVFGYRIDQLLKTHNAEIDVTASALETAEDEQP
jgi:hypothetical protein